jgi:hypothetical protein
MSYATGERHPMRKLTEAQVLEMRALNREGESTYSLAKRYGKSTTATWLACKGFTWKILRRTSK